MGGIINKVNNVLTRFLGRIAGFEYGGFELSHGHHKFEVELRMDDINKVWINTEECVADGCGNIPVNSVGCTVLPCRLIFEADIQTDTCKIEWFAIS